MWKNFWMLCLKNYNNNLHFVKYKKYMKFYEKVLRLKSFSLSAILKGKEFKRWAIGKNPNDQAQMSNLEFVRQRRIGIWNFT